MKAACVLLNREEEKFLSNFKWMEYVYADGDFIVPLTRFLYFFCKFL